MSRYNPGDPPIAHTENPPTPRFEEEPFFLARVGAGEIPVLCFAATGMARQDRACDTVSSGKMRCVLLKTTCHLFSLVVLLQFLILALFNFFALWLSRLLSKPGRCRYLHLSFRPSEVQCRGLIFSVMCLSLEESGFSLRGN